MDGYFSLAATTFFSLNILHFFVCCPSEIVAQATKVWMIRAHPVEDESMIAPYRESTFRKRVFLLELLF